MHLSVFLLVMNSAGQTLLFVDTDDHPVWLRKTIKISDSDSDSVDCIVYSDIVNTFKSFYLHSILSIVIIETPECQHCIVWQWAAFRARGNGKFPTIKQSKFDLKLSGK